jgi:hypothetical protein
MSVNRRTPLSRYSIARRQTDREPTKKWAHLMELQRQRDVQGRTARGKTDTAC